ncbi:phytoene/squalene synthase family protein [Urechidicola sp. KH5]
MKSIFDHTAHKCTRVVTKSYSTSFSLAVRMLAPSIRQDIYNIYAFVRFADEIVDSFHEYDKSSLLDDFERDYYKAHRDGISLNPILNSFQETVKRYEIDDALVQSFLKSMKLDLEKSEYKSIEDYKEYIYGSADVVGLMCLKVFVNGNQEKYDTLKAPAMRLGSAFQKVNFLRDLKDDFEILNRSYFPDVNFESLDKASKLKIIAEIEEDFAEAYKGIKQLPIEAKFGVYTAFRYYSKLLKKLKKIPSEKIISSRVRVPNYAKMHVLARSFVVYKLNLL